MSTFFPGGIFQVSGLVSPAMQLRDRTTGIDDEFT